MSGPVAVPMPSEGRCSQDHCSAPDVTCNLGADDFRRCQYWCANERREDAGTDQSSDAQSGLAAGAAPTLRAAWSGSAFGLADLELVAARGRPRVVGIVGHSGAGKTTLLAAAYLGVRRTGKIGESLFAGSYTLGGWEAVAHSMQWRGGEPPGFPLHTSSRSSRAPGLLHLALRTDSGQGLTDLLATDAPGEWFARWAVQRNAADTDGARWVAANSDVFVLVVDSDALAGPRAGSARGQTRMLAQRLGVESQGKPVAIVWAKADVAIPPSVRKSVEEAMDQYLPGAPQYHISVCAPGADTELGFDDVLSWALRAAPSKSTWELSSTIASGSIQTTDPLVAFRVRTSTGLGSMNDR